MVGIAELSPSPLVMLIVNGLTKRLLETELSPFLIVTHNNMHLRRLRSLLFYCDK